MPTIFTFTYIVLSVIEKGLMENFHVQNVEEPGNIEESYIEI